MKYTIMLVEDEPPILYAIKYLIETKNNDFNVIATAHNGREALKALEEQVPDIIITDIQMPFVNGLELIEAVQISYPQIKCVILTGYSDFEYARKALRMNVIDYLLKPIQLDQLNILLESLKRTLHTHRAQNEQTALNNAILFEQYAEQSLTNLSNKFFATVIICAGHFAHETWDTDHPGRSFWDNKNLLELVQICSNQMDTWILNGFNSNERIIIVGLDAPDQTSIKAFVSKLMQKLFVDGIPIQIIYGEPVIQINDLSHKTKKLRMALAKKIVFGASGIFRDENVTEASFVIPNNEENRLVYLAKQPNLVAFKKNFQSLLKEWESKKYMQVWIESLLEDLKNKLAQAHFAEMGKLSSSSLMDSKVISDSMSYSELFENYCSSIRNIYENTSHKFLQTSAAEIVTHMEEYLQNHFTTTISYRKFHDLFGFNETYLSQVFKQQLGITPNKYVTKLRIEKAKELMIHQPDTPLKNIAALIGYEDAFYFSRVFKETTGISPSEFMNQSKEQEPS